MHWVLSLCCADLVRFALYAGSSLSRLGEDLESSACFVKYTCQPAGGGDEASLLLVNSTSEEVSDELAAQYMQHIMEMQARNLKKLFWPARHSL